MPVLALSPCCHVTVALLQLLYLQYIKSAKMAASLSTIGIMTCNHIYFIIIRVVGVSVWKPLSWLLVPFLSSAALHLFVCTFSPHSSPCFCGQQTHILYNKAFFPSSGSHYWVSWSVMCYRWSFHFTLCAPDCPSVCKHTHSISRPPVNRPLLWVSTSHFLLLHDQASCQVHGSFSQHHSYFVDTTHMLRISYVCSATC